MSNCCSFSGVGYASCLLRRREYSCDEEGESSYYPIWPENRRRWRWLTGMRGRWRRDTQSPWQLHLKWGVDASRVWWIETDDSPPTMFVVCSSNNAFLKRWGQLWPSRSPLSPIPARSALEFARSSGWEKATPATRETPISPTTRIREASIWFGCASRNEDTYLAISFLACHQIPHLIRG